MHFLHPIWLWLSAAVAVPIVIHLWNIRHGKTLRVGSIALLEESARSHARSFRISEWLLLLLRCLLIVLLSLLLASPFFERKPKTGGHTGWVLLEKGQAAAAYKAYQREIDSCLDAGFELHWLAPGFEKTSLAGALRQAADTGLLPTYWSTLSALDTTLPPGTPVRLYTNDRLDRFNGSRPKLMMDLAWKTFGSTDSIAVTGSRPDTSFHVCIYATANVDDAKYLRAALAAIGDYTGRKMVVTQAKNPEAIPPAQDFIFWLSAPPLPAQTQGIPALVYADGAIVEKPSRLITREGKMFRLFKSVRAQSDAPQDTVWTDGFGNPVLSRSGRQLRFYSRFNPQWNDLVWSADFPTLIHGLLFPYGGRSANTKDMRRIAAGQMMPERIDAAKEAARVEKADVSKIIWLIAFVLFVTERLLVYRKSALHA